MSNLFMTKLAHLGTQKSSRLLLISESVQAEQDSNL